VTYDYLLLTVQFILHRAFYNKLVFLIRADCVLCDAETGVISILWKRMPVLPSKHKIQNLTPVPNFLPLLHTQISISHHPTFFTTQCFTMPPAYLYQKAERALRGNFESRNFLPSPSIACNATS
jgi:hypothetical protein